jgi:hypothetical protein
VYVAGVKFVGFIKPWQRKEGVKRKTVAAEAVREKPVVNMLTHKTWMMILIPVCYFLFIIFKFAFFGLWDLWGCFSFSELLVLM